MTNSEWMTTAQVCERLGVKRDLLRAMVGDGRFPEPCPHYKQKPKHWITAEVEAWIRARIEAVATKS